MNHPHDAMRVLTKGRIVVTTRNVTWRRIPGTNRSVVFGRVEGPTRDDDDGADSAGEFEFTRSGGGQMLDKEGSPDSGTDGAKPVEVDTQSDGASEGASGVNTLIQESESNHDLDV